jgi:hypothetical protein
MTVWNSLRSTFVSALHHPRLWLLQFFGNAAIVIIFGLWLHIPDSHWWQLFFQFVIVLLLTVAALVLHGGTMNYYANLCGNKTAGLGQAFRNALKHVLAFAVFVVILHFLLHLVNHLDNYQYEFPGYLRSEFPAWLRRHISEDAMDELYTGFVAFLRWVLVPGLLLPLGLLCANIGFRGFLQFGRWWHGIRNLAYWIVVIVAAVIGVYCTSKLMEWTLQPEGPAVTKEGIWLGFRMLVAYLLALFSWLWVCAMLARAHFRPDPPAASQKVAAA